MGVYKRKLKKGIRWYFSGQFQCQQYFSKAIYLTKAECQKAERERLQEIEAEIDAPQPENEMLLVDVMSTRLDEIKANHSTYYYYENQRYFKMLVQHVSDIPVSSVTKAEINSLVLAFSKDLRLRRKTNHKANAMIRSLKAFFNYAITIYDIEMRNPCVGIKMFPLEIKLKYIPSDAEIKAIRDGLNEEERFLFDFVEQTGCRINEALRLKYEDIQGKLVTLWTHKSKNSDLTPRRIPIPPCLHYKKGKGKVFGDLKENPRFIQEKVKEIGCKRWNWHNLRHRRASIWAGEGRTLLEIMQLLGHSNLSTTQKYLQILGHIKL